MQEYLREFYNRPEKSYFWINENLQRLKIMQRPIIGDHWPFELRDMVIILHDEIIITEEIEFLIHYDYREMK